MRLAVWLALLVLAASAADAEPRPRLRAFRSCADLVAFARRGAERTGGGVGVVPRAAPPGGEAIVRPRLVPPGAKAPAAPVPTAGGDGGTAFSGTNVQEAGVDEPDVVKTDGERVFAVTDGTLRVIDVSHGAPELVGTLKLAGYDQRLLIRGDRVLAIASQGLSTVLPVRGVPVPAIGLEGPGAATTIVTEIHVADDGSPSVLRTMTVPGRFVDARQHGGTARLVIDAAPAPIAVPARARLGRFLGR